MGSKNIIDLKVQTLVPEKELQRNRKSDEGRLLKFDDQLQANTKFPSKGTSVQQR